MGKEPEDIRREIQQTRRRLMQDVDVLAEKLNPAQILDRQKEAAKEAVSDGVAGAGDAVRGVAENLRDKAGDLKDKVLGDSDDDDGPGPGSGGAHRLA